MTRRPRPEPIPYPEWLGRWPAVIGLLAFLWLELVFPSGTAAGGVLPRDVAIATIAYTGITLFAMAAFGTERWLDRGETFSAISGCSRGSPRSRCAAGASACDACSRPPASG